MTCRDEDRDGAPPSERVVDAVAAVNDTDPISLSPPLYDAVDADALDRLVADSSADVRVRFEYADHEVTVRPDGAVVVDDTAFGPAEGDR